MTTVKDLINELEKMPKEMEVLLNFNKDSNIMKVHFDNIYVEKHEFKTPWNNNEKTEYVVLNQVPII